MNKHKIFNDPVYGFVSIDYEIIFDLIQHPFFQRLRRISQLGMTSLTYPGAVHTRLHHALGALHLMKLTIDVLRQKGTQITDEEAEAASVAILLHDIGHGPFSHALEGKLVETSHEVLSLRLIEWLNKEFNGRLDLSVKIFKNAYHKQFLHQLIASQLDLDRLDYLNRDSFYTGVMEGKIGYDRIVKMFRVVDGELMIEEKGLASIEKFLVARKIMYWQVYLHKTVLSAERMLIGAIDRAKVLYNKGQLALSTPLGQLLSRKWSDKHSQEEILKAFVQLDDVDIMSLLKSSTHSDDYILNTLASGLVERKLYRVELQEKPATSYYLNNLIDQIGQHLQINRQTAEELVWSGVEQVEIYNGEVNQIKVYKKDGQIAKLSDIADFKYLLRIVKKYYHCYPRI
jgi:HD superfamily phosphohydrolase